MGALVVLLDEGVAVLDLDPLGVAAEAGVGDVDGVDRGRGVVLGPDVVAAVAVGAAHDDRVFGPVGLAVDARPDLAASLSWQAAQAAGLSVSAWGKSLTLQVGMAVRRSRSGLAVDRGLDVGRVDEDGSSAAGLEVLVGVAGQAVVVRGGGAAQADAARPARRQGQGGRARRGRSWLLPRAGPCARRRRTRSGSRPGRQAPDAAISDDEVGGRAQLGRRRGGGSWPGDLLRHARVASRPAAGLRQVGGVDARRGIDGRPDVVDAVAVRAVRARPCRRSPMAMPWKLSMKVRMRSSRHAVLLHDLGPGVAGGAGVGDVLLGRRASGRSRAAATACSPWQSTQSGTSRLPAQGLPAVDAVLVRRRRRRPWHGRRSRVGPVVPALAQPWMLWTPWQSVQTAAKRASPFSNRARPWTLFRYSCRATRRGCCT